MIQLKNSGRFKFGRAQAQKPSSKRHSLLRFAKMASLMLCGGQNDVVDDDSSMFDRAVTIMVGGCSGVACAGSNGASDDIDSSRPGEYEYIDLRRKAKPPLPNDASAAATKDAVDAPAPAAPVEDMPVVIGSPEYPSNRGAKAGS